MSLHILTLGLSAKFVADFLYFGVKFAIICGEIFKQFWRERF